MAYIDDPRLRRYPDDDAVACGDVAVFEAVISEKADDRGHTW
jgi:hypothetical protein